MTKADDALLWWFFFPFNPTQVECQNYIRVLARTTGDAGDDDDDDSSGSGARLLVCGTNAYAPRCRRYRQQQQQQQQENRGNDGDGYAWDDEFSGRGFCPYDPRHNSTSLYTGEWLSRARRGLGTGQQPSFSSPFLVSES